MRARKRAAKGHPHSVPSERGPDQLVTALMKNGAFRSTPLCATAIDSDSVGSIIER